MVEEAAEVLEAHVVASLTTHCQHLILLGDHQQLKPHHADHVIGTRYHLGVSLFERMVNNGIQCYQLNIQHRMRPEISTLLKSTTYPFLQDHESVKENPPIRGMDKPLFFITHHHPETTSDFTNKKNYHEARFLAALARHLILNGYGLEEIAILTTYSGQVTQLRREAQQPSNNLLKGVRISTLDAFQGQEAEIVLLSLVRSQAPGFLSDEYRICVALSRAKNGFYIIGNMDLLAKHSQIWTTVKGCLEEQSAISEELILRCQFHPEAARKFSRCVWSGQKCQGELLCGHRCRFLCHPFDRKHEEYGCRELCGREVCKGFMNHGEVCRRMCFEDCERCFDCGQGGSI